MTKQLLRKIFNANLILEALAMLLLGWYLCLDGMDIIVLIFALLAKKDINKAGKHRVKFNFFKIYE